MPAGVTLRPETEDDVPFLLAVYGSTRAEEMALVPWTEEQKDEFVRMQFRFQRKHYLENYGGATFDIVMVEGRPAGRLYVFRGSSEIRIIDIALLPDYRGRGVGGGLLAEVLEEARGKGLVVSIHVERNNPAQHLYQRLGFQFAGERGPVYLLMEYRAA
ncbi:MAG TPA: GNAT family N-acetyltransferase [Bryobacteraceae bacterium]|nr:GNAT family N-acetyltransferase [Bryobacteraceae bacterium]